MEEFDPMKVNSYTIAELADMICNNVVSKDDIYAVGLSATKRPDLEAELRRRETIKIDEQEAWDLAVKSHTIDSYKRYLRRYDVHPSEGYRGKHVAEAKDAISDLEIIMESLRSELFKAMRETPWVFKAEGVKKLLSGVNRPDELEALRSFSDITSRFLASGQKITYEELVKLGIIPPSIKLENLVAEDQFLRQTNIKELGAFPEEKRTDVYFFGVPRGGKSSVLAGILSTMDKQGVALYQPHWNENNQDLVKRYYSGLIESTKKGKFPVSTATDSVSFMKLQLRLRNRRNDLTFVEIGGEAFKQAYESSMKGDLAWGELGAKSCLKSNNRKLLFFILDYGLRDGISNQSTETEQKHILTTALEILSSDGGGREGKNGCTLSKVDTVAVIVTKSDLMKTGNGDERIENRDKRTAIAHKYVQSEFASFMTALESACTEFGINKAVNYKPYIMSFSLGRLFIGNTYAYDSKDSEDIVSFISDVTSGTNTSIFGRIFGND